ncbi:ferredoxin/adrenodoxin [Anaeramoeba flamelloides]|uniref:Ferredoxin/adrenodoxin n=1 Tax=Anaeramoeba flamelloides TaxID=1746091 RepID=A0AAV7Z803_9EUKA|nr:ferredoxin/adrenodoxin [Anaeramoeba flamelloides]KAJ6231062.1 ferredoxin/adrenodoxin [Anaeramoeba flamelloides]
MLSNFTKNINCSIFQNPSGLCVPKRFLEVFVVDTKGNKHTVPFEDGDNLFESIHEAGLDIIHGSCNGGIACGECVTLIPEERKEDVSEQEEDEADCLEATGNKIKNARLACGMILDEDSEGIVFTIAPFDN